MKYNNDLIIIIIIFYIAHKVLAVCHSPASEVQAHCSRELFNVSIQTAVNSVFSG